MKQGKDKELCGVVFELEVSIRTHDLHTHTHISQFPGSVTLSNNVSLSTRGARRIAIYSKKVLRDTGNGLKGNPLVTFGTIGTLGTLRTINNKTLSNNVTETQVQLPATLKAKKVQVQKERFIQVPQPGKMVDSHLKDAPHFLLKPAVLIRIGRGGKNFFSY